MTFCLIVLFQSTFVQPKLESATEAIMDKLVTISTTVEQHAGKMAVLVEDEIKVLPMRCSS